MSRKFDFGSTNLEKESKIIKCIKIQKGFYKPKPL